MMRFPALTILGIALSFACYGQNGFTIKEEVSKKEVRVFYNDKFLTAYCYYDSSRKPMLYPVNTVNGITVTRGYPFDPRPGERTDHPHHSGVWLNYESVNGLDFWNNSTAIPLEKRDRYGTIVHQDLKEKHADASMASIVIAAKWNRPDGKTILNEETRYVFRIDKSDFIIDRYTTLTATDLPVAFKDVKDGFFAIRVARELEMPSKEPSEFVDDKGNITKVAPSGNDVTGIYTGSTGLKGDEVWGSKGRWAMLSGKKDGAEISVAIFDHPSNPGYPAYWHARGYGLFSINPLGRKVFSKGKEELNFNLQPRQSATFRYRILIHTGPVPDASTLNKLADDFAQVK